MCMNTGQRMIYSKAILWGDKVVVLCFSMDFNATFNAVAKSEGANTYLIVTYNYNDFKKTMESVIGKQDTDLGISKDYSLDSLLDGGHYEVHVQNKKYVIAMMEDYNKGVGIRIKPLLKERIWKVSYGIITESTEKKQKLDDLNPLLLLKAEEEKKDQN